MKDTLVKAALRVIAACVQCGREMGLSEAKEHAFICSKCRGKND